MARPSKQEVIKSIYDILGGRPILLPIAKAMKRPVDNGWNEVGWEETQKPAYQKRLASGNVGVKLGPGSVLEENGRTFHLVTVDIDDDAEIDNFIHLNAWAKETLQTAGSRGRNFWLWVDASESYVPMEGAAYIKLWHAKICEKTGAYLRESDQERPWGEWRCGGGGRGAQTVIYGVHPTGERYRRVSPPGVQPARVKFSEIEWPEYLHVPWRKTKLEILSDTYGIPWHETERGRLILNPPFFVAKYSEEHICLYEAEEREFYEYLVNLGLWRKQSVDSVKWQFVEDFGEMAKLTGNGQLNSVRSNSFLSSMADLLKGCIERRDVFQPQPGLIHLKNGMLDLRRDPPELMRFSADFYSRNQIPVDWDPDRECPLFMEFLHSGLNDDDIDLLQRYLGGVLIGVNLAQRFLILRGTPGGGKSTLIDIVRSIIGEENAAALRTEMLTERFEISAFIGKTFLVGADVKANFLNHPSAYVIKQLVGGDMIPAELKAGKTIQIKGIFNLAVVSNSDLLVNLEGDAGAYRRRMLIIEYNRPRVENPDPQLKHKILTSEASGVLRWMVEGAVRYLDECRPDNGGDLRLSTRQQERVDNILCASDSLREFVRKGLVLMPGQVVTKSEIQEAYIDFCEERGWQSVSGRRFGSQLNDLMMEVHRRPERNDIVRGEGKRQRGYSGVTLVRPESPVEAATTEGAF